MDDLIPNLRDERVQGAVKNLLVYSIVILLVPLGSMFLLKQFLFEDIFGYTSDDALTFSAVIAVILVHVVLCLWLFAANPPVYLGFCHDLETDNLYRLRRIFLPLGKIGGKPSWLNPKILPSTTDLQCGVCKKAMCFLIQIYATHEDDPSSAFHRALFVFICRDQRCSKRNDATNMAVFRCCLPRENPFYSFDGPLDPDLVGNTSDPYLPVDAPNLCEICGCYASKKCGRCGVVWYCCRDHQALDWTSLHKDGCGTNTLSEALPANPSNSFLFKEYGIEMDQEYVPAKFFENGDDDEDDDECFNGNCDEADDVERRNMIEFERYLATNKVKNERFEIEDIEAAVSDQPNDLRFERRYLDLNCEQILRYQRSGNPLWATDRAPTLNEAPPCEKCGAARHFEFQLMPRLLSLIDVDQLG
ncbi:VMA21-like domain protein [Dictyocaulus viviparus]|uniref:VMA21-like domain protein n=1 Tax=Dictyocaulus viviparus TaxID=29172 RepID=A0A0D8XE44_DICVI|nr:VMA21-like domain protein [Dictyocaulus viviparus]